MRPASSKTLHCILLTLLAFVVFCSVAAAADSNAPLQIVGGPYLQAPATDGMTIVWKTNRNCASRVEYGTEGKLDCTALSTHHGLVDANSTLHKIRLNGLKPGTTYRYRVVSQEIAQFKPYNVEFGEIIHDDENTFTTLSDGERDFSFIVLADRHEKVPELRTALAGVDWGGVDLVFGDGDMYSHLESEKQIFEKIIGPCCEVFASRIPMILVRGNHETRGAFARNLFDYFPSTAGRFYYSFDHAGVHFIVLDSGEDKADSTKVYAGLVDFDRYRSEQSEWLKQDIKSAAFRRARFRIVLLHMPPYYGNDWHGEQDLRSKVAPLLNEGKIDLLICGHTHHYAFHAPDEEMNRFPLLISAPDTVLRIDVSRRQMSVSVTRDDGTAVDTFEFSARHRFPFRFPRFR